MGDECRFCGSERVVPVLDKRIEQSPTAGNKYRTRCLTCWRWLPMTSGDHWKEHPNAKVLPADADPEENDNLVDAEDAEDGRLAELQEKVSNRGVSAERAVTDGGEEPSVKEESDDEQEDVNRFTCPAESCDNEMTGYPDKCGTCGTPYTWDSEEED